jgi:hypothetical protein
MEVETIQPTAGSGNRIRGNAKYFGGSQRSVARLRKLDFDPITELVNKYRQLDGELDRQIKIRNNVLVELTSTGRPKSYNPETTMSIYDKQIAIAEKLLRYNYGRVPEISEEQQRAPMPLIVNLTKKGDTYIVNNEVPDDTPDEDNDNSW